MWELCSQASPWCGAVNVWSAKTRTFRFREVRGSGIDGWEPSRHILCGLSFCVLSIYDFKVKRKSSLIHEKLSMTHSQYFRDNFAGTHYAGVQVCLGGKPVSRSTSGSVPLVGSLYSFSRKTQSAAGHPMYFLYFSWFLSIKRKLFNA